MRTTTLAIIVAGTTLAGCHHRRSEPNDTMGTTNTTTTTTTTDGMSPSSGDMSPSSTTTSSTTTSTTMPAQRNDARRESSGAMHNDMRMERREVHMGVRSLERARHELQHAGHEFGGRRADALKAVDAALHELRLASGQEARDARAGMETPSERRAEGREMHMALVDIERARADMEHASHNFSGRRKEALEAVDAAIREVRRAVEYEK